jgi:ribosomal protein L11 methyltransferase
VIRLGVRVRREHAERALLELLAFSPGGVEEVELDAQTIEYALYGAADELPADATLAAALASAFLGAQRSELADDWQERWREFHRPARVAERLWVRAPWHEVAPPGLIDIVIEPAQAFGTGAHATTRLCLELLVTLERTGEASGSLLDVGCGSGVLAIAASRLGFAPVVALDNDPLAVSAAAANALANSVGLAPRLADLLTDELPSARTVVANLLFEPLLALASRLERPPRHLIVSGLLEAQGEALTAVMPMAERERRSEGEWLAILYGGPPDRRVSS